jgi:cell wall-associated NlpC family hydrolase/outer membrane murein-binding lipoprotein Lpp
VAKRLRAKHIASTTQFRRGALLVVALATATGAAVYAGAAGAGAAATPTIGQVQSQVNSLQSKMDKLDEQYDAANQDYSAAQSRLAQVDKQATSAQARYDAARGQLAQVAVSMYENSDQTSILGLLNAGNPTAVLSQASLVMEVAGMHNQEATQFLTSAQELASIREQRQRTEQGIAQIRAKLTAEKTSLNKLLNTSKATLDSLTAAQQAQVAAASVGGTTSTTTTGQTSTGQTSTGQTGTTPIAYTGPTTTQADKAVAFAYAQLGKPYQYGATGPDSYDCSGLVMAAWASAGVNIPRDTYEQWAALPHIPVSQMQPGDLIIYDGEGPVAMYVGDGYIIDAPHTGADVERIPYDTSWYVDNQDGVLQP